MSLVGCLQKIRPLVLSFLQSREKCYWRYALLVKPLPVNTACILGECTMLHVYTCTCPNRAYGGKHGGAHDIVTMFSGNIKMYVRIFCGSDAKLVNFNFCENCLRAFS